MIGYRFAFYNQFIGVIFTISIIALCSVLTLHGKLQIGEFIAILLLGTSIIPSVFNLVSSNIRFQEVQLAFDRIFEMNLLQSEHEEITEIKKCVINSIDIKDLSFGFPNRPSLLDNISLKAEKNQIITLFGETGCGKSTILKILQKLLQPESGKIYINNEDWDQFSIPEWRENIALVPQHIKILGETLAENIVLGYVYNQIEEFIAFCNQYGFNKYFEQLPRSYMTSLGEDGTNLSAGQLQLMALARALYKKPQILLLDDATSAMDSNTEDFVLNLLNKIKKDVITIMVTHRAQVAQKTDFIYVLGSGKIEHSGTHDQLMEYDNLYRKSFLNFPVPVFA
jgi:ATP-binding cassette subfamily B protein